MNEIKNKQQKIDDEVNSFINSFRINQNRKEITVRSWTGTEKHSILHNAMFPLKEKGFNVSWTPPEYDGMVTWTVKKNEHSKI
jgi:cysteine sulfinate desulfinase/cysteine desulfurase-like protein